LIPNPHDRLVKKVFSDLVHARAFLQGALPAALVDQIDLPTLRQAPADLLDELLDERHGDLLFEVELRSGGGLFLHVILEHQSTVDPQMPWRLLRYMVRIWGQANQRPAAQGLPPIVAVVLYHGATPWTAPRSFHAQLAPNGLPAELGPLVPQFTYALVDLSALSDEQLHGSATGRLALLLLKHAHDGDLWERLPRWKSALQATLRSPTGLQAISVVMSYIVEVSAGPPSATIQHFIRQELGDSAMKTFISWGDQLRDEGRRAGREEGREEGRQEGALHDRRQYFLWLAEQRFGSLDPGFHRLVEQADRSQLDAWSTRLLSATNPDELFRLH
jgi:predicted transposase YdaD